MLLMQHHQEMLTQRLIVIGVPKTLITPLIREMVKWEQHSGVEWTIKRLKGLKIDLIRMRSKQSPTTWIRKNRRGEIAGVIGSIIRWSLKNDRNFRKGVQVFMAYTFYIFPELTPSQEKKFRAAINADPSDGLDPEFIRSFKRFLHRVVDVRPIVDKPQPLVIYSGSPSKRAPRLFGQRSTYQNENILDDLQIFNTDGGRYLFQKYNSIYRPLLRGFEERMSFMDTPRPYPKSTVIGGQIHFLQEPGGKLRSIASPLRIHQEALRPLGKLLYREVERRTWDCTFNSERAHSSIQSHLEKGGEVHSIDLSSATDLFPLSIQMLVLRALLPKEDQHHADLFEEISRSTWNSKLGDLTWTKGQPLGLYPSFGLFTFTHGLLLHYLSQNLRISDSFFVLGDDVVILNDSLKVAYVNMLHKMGCPWSPEKSLSSTTLSEFAGKIITKDWVIPQLKWRKVSDDNFLDICRLLGQRSRSLLSGRQRKVFDWAAYLCYPIGLNFSKQGDNLAKAVERTLEAYRPEEVVLASLMDLRRRIHRNIYSSSENVTQCELDELSSTFDEKVMLALTHTCFRRWHSSVLMGLEGLESLPAALNIENRLPLKVTNPPRTSTLLRYEMLIRR